MGVGGWSHQNKSKAGSSSGGGGEGIGDGGWGGEGLLDGGLDGGVGEVGVAHHVAEGGIIEDGDEELLELDLDGKEGGLLLVGAATTLVGLGVLEGGHEGVGERRVRNEIDAGGGWEAVEGDGEAELEVAALERVGGEQMGAGAGLAEESDGGGQEGGGHMQRRRLAVSPPGRLHDGPIKHRYYLHRQRLLDRCQPHPHLSLYFFFKAGK